jgi:hypothetical protein
MAGIFLAEKCVIPRPSAKRSNQGKSGQIKPNQACGRAHKPYRSHRSYSSHPLTPRLLAARTCGSNEICGSLGSRRREPADQGKSSQIKPPAPRSLRSSTLSLTLRLDHALAQTDRTDIERSTASRRSPREFSGDRA